MAGTFYRGADDGNPDVERNLRDGLTGGRPRGRGAHLNPGNRHDAGRSGDGVRLHVLGEHLDRLAEEHPDGVQVRTETIAERTRSVLNRVDSPDLPMSWTFNPYRGCEHGCVYCYARPTHENLGMSCGLDFETKIVAKHDAPRLLRRELSRAAWRGEPIAMSGVTDPYQPVERRLEITRSCLALFAACRQPVGIITKNRLVLRDVDHLRDLAAQGATSVAVSVTTLDDDLARSMEPRASAPRARLETIRTLADAGIPVMVMVAPVIPGLTDHEMPAILAAAAEAGARSAGWVILRLPHQLKALFVEWLSRTRPDRAAKILAAVRDTRDGALYDDRYGVRQRGEGARAESIARTFKVFTKRHGLDRPMPALSSDAFIRPGDLGQGTLW